MQIRMDSTDWLKEIIHEDVSEMESSPSPIELIACPRPPHITERRQLRPQQDQAIKCPRCDSTHTKFCYYNNYSLSQPRYFCKTCRRYWTKGGSLRNVPVGGSCRKNKRSSPKKPVEKPHRIQPIPPFPDSTNLQLSFPAMQLPQLSLLTPETPYTECKYNSMLGGFHLFMNNESDHGLQLGGSSHGFNSTSSGIFPGTNRFVYSDVDGSNEALMEACQSLFPFEVNQDGSNALEIKPGERVLSLPNCHDQCCTVDAARPQSMVYPNRLESWLE